MSKYEGKKITEATMAGPIHTIKSGHLKKELSSIANSQNKPVEMVMVDNFVEVTTTTRNGKETILVPITNFSHLVLAKE